MTTRNLMPAVRTLNRLLAPLMGRLGAAEAADAGFDAGEFSAPYHASVWQAAYDATVRSVAAAYDCGTAELEAATMKAEYEQCQMIYFRHL